MRTLDELNRAENSTELSPEEKSAVVDRLCHPAVEGWTNGEAHGGRAEEREREVQFYAAVPDYHRDLEMRIIDPPRAAIAWRIRGTLGGEVIDTPGSTIFEFDEESRIRRFWLYFHSIGPV
jgi:hypothetical protein